MCIIDAPNFIYRSHFASPHLKSKNRPTSVLHSGLLMLINMRKFIQPQRIIFLWDGPISFRKTLDTSYKANRTDMMADRQLVLDQMHTMKSLLLAAGFAHLEAAHLEADDLAGILTTALLRQKKEVVLVSSDKDWFQLLCPNVTQIRGWDDKKVDVWTAERVEQKFGVSCNRWAEYLALQGDAVDNIPKVRRGLGPVGAAKALQQGIDLTEEEQKRFALNLRLTTVCRRLKPSGLSFLNTTPPLRTDAGWKYIEATLMEYELFHVWAERRHLWMMGGWR